MKQFSISVRIIEARNQELQNVTEERLLSVAEEIIRVSQEKPDE